MNEFNNLMMFCRFLRTGVDELIVEYDRDEARRLFAEHLFNLMLEAGVDTTDADLLSDILTEKFFDEYLAEEN